MQWMEERLAPAVNLAISDLPFLPPYCPDHNKIERVWQDLHANVTRNHNCPTIVSRMREVRYCLRKRNRKVLNQSKRLPANLQLHQPAR